MNRKLFLCCWMLLPLLVLSCGRGGGRLQVYVTGMAGEVQVFRKGSDSWVDLDTAEVVRLQDTIRVGHDSYLELTFQDTNVVKLGENTKVHWVDTKDSLGNRVLEVFNHHGRVHTQLNALGAPFKGYRVRTPKSLACAKGTAFCVTYTLHTREAEVVVVAGEVEVVAPDMTPEPVSVTPGHFVVVPWGKPIRPPARVNRARWLRVERVIKPPVPLKRPRTRFAGRRPPTVKRVVPHKKSPVVKHKTRKPRKPFAGQSLHKGRPAKTPRALKPGRSGAPRPGGGPLGAHRPPRKVHVAPKKGHAPRGGPAIQRRPGFAGKKPPGHSMGKGVGKGKDKDKDKGKKGKGPKPHGPRKKKR